jgi:hypothetical protein
LLLHVSEPLGAVKLSNGPKIQLQISQGCFVRLAWGQSAATEVEVM